MRSHSILAATALAISVSSPVTAESLHPQLETKHLIILGGYRQKADAEFFADTDRFEKKTVDLNGLDLNDTYDSFTLEYRYRLSEKWLFSAAAYNFDSNGKTSAQKDFVYDGIEYQAGAELKSHLQLDTYIFDALYKVYGSDRAEILVGGGLHLIDFSADIEATVFLDDDSRSGQAGTNDILAPLPNLRLQGFYAFTPKWAVAATLGWLSAKYEDYDGSFAYLHARTVYRVTERFGLGIGYQFLNVDLTVDKAHGEAGFDVEFKGPAVYLSYSF